MSNIDVPVSDHMTPSCLPQALEKTSRTSDDRDALNSVSVV